MAKTEDQFSYAEFAVAGDMTKRAFQHLMDASAKVSKLDWLPTGPGIRKVKRVSVIGGLVGAGVPLYSAARLAAALVFHEFNTYDGEVPSGLSFLARKLPSSALVNMPISGDDNDYWYHRALIENPNIYVPSRALNSDAMVEIVDRTHVYIAAMSGIGILNPWDEKADKASYIGRIDGWERDGEAVFISAGLIAPLDQQDPDFKSKGAKLNEMSRSAYRNAVGRITVNVSLAVRNGLDRIARHRGFLPTAPVAEAEGGANSN